MTDKPTREQVLAEPAGRVIDAWVAEQVMGLNLDKRLEPLSYSLCLADTWEVVKKMKKDGWKNSFEDCPKEPAFAIFYTDPHPDLPEEIIEGSSEAETIHLAICRAALLAVIDD